MVLEQWTINIVKKIKEMEEGKEWKEMEKILTSTI